MTDATHNTSAPTATIPAMAAITAADTPSRTAHSPDGDGLEVACCTKAPSGVMSMVSLGRVRSVMANSWHVRWPKQVFFRQRAVVTEDLTWLGRLPAQAVLLALAAFLTSSAWAVDKPAGAQAVPLDMQDTVEAAIMPFLVVPQTAKWDFVYMVDRGSEKVVCGTVNYQSSLKQYLGPKPFYARMRDGKIVRMQLQDPPWVDTSGAEARDFHYLCPALYDSKDG
jgi:hypothetical protein